MMNSLPQTTNGYERKQAAHAMLEDRRKQYVRLGRRAFLLHLIEYGTATADDIRAAVDLPESINAKLFGAVPGPLAKAGIIRQVGFVPTTRAVAHGRPVSVWALVDEVKARAWLAANPPLPTTAASEQLMLPMLDGRAGR
jgi:hypothetical protein